MSRIRIFSAPQYLIRGILGHLQTRQCSRRLPSLFQQRASIACRFSSRHIWSPPPEPERPPLPYRQGYLFNARRVRAPPPFLGRYANVPTGQFRHFLDTTRLPGRDFLRTTTIVDYCISVASNPLPCEPLGEMSTFEVLCELSVGDGKDRGRGAQAVVCRRQGHAEPLVAKIFDPLYYPFTDQGFPSVPNDVVARAEHDFALESAAYAQLDERLGGRLIPQFHGSWLLEVPLKHQSRSVPFVLLERVEGMPLGDLDPARYSLEERLGVLALCMEAELELHHAGVLHGDMAPRNIICSGPDLQAKDLRVKVIDFGLATILPVLGIAAPCESKSSPKSPVELFRDSRPVDLRQWVPEGWGMLEWNRWLEEKYISIAHNRT